MRVSDTDDALAGRHFAVTLFGDNGGVRSWQRISAKVDLRPR
jgi:hypothetical protein